MEVNDHEEARRQRIEENRKRMQELGLLDMVEGLRPERNSKPPGRKEPNLKTSSPHQSAGLAHRRSARTATKPPVDYKDAKEADKYIGSSPADIAVMEAVDEAFTKLANPGFVRHALYSYGAGSYHAYIPMAFRYEHMPETDRWFTLEDEDQMEWRVLFVAEVGDFRTGWRKFSSHHALMAGDCCLFELVSLFRFTVQIFRYDQHDGGGSRSRSGSNRKRMSDEGQWNEKVSSRRTSAVPEDVLIDRKPKLEAELLEEYRNGGRREAGLAIPIDKDRKVKAEILEDHRNGDRREAGLTIPMDKETKVKAEPEAEILEDRRNGDRREAGLAIPIDKDPKVKAEPEVEILEDHRDGYFREAVLAIPVNRDPKVKAEPVEDYQHVPREAHLSIPIDRKPKLENIEDYRSAHPQETPFSSPIPARMPIPKGGNWTLDNPD